MLSLIRKLTSSSSNRPAPSESSRKRTIGQLDIFLSLLIPQPEFVMAGWDISSATKQYLGKMFLNFVSPSSLCSPQIPSWRGSH